MTTVIDRLKNEYFTRRIVKIKETRVVSMRSIILFIFTDILFLLNKTEDAMWLFVNSLANVPAFIDFSKSVPT